MKNRLKEFMVSIRQSTTWMFPFGVPLRSTQRWTQASNRIGEGYHQTIFEWTAGQ